MTSSSLLSVTTFLYLAVALGYLSGLIFKIPKAARFGSILGWLTTGLQTAAIILRWVESYKLGIGHAPMTNMYESMIFFAWAIMLAYLILEWRHPRVGLGAAVAPFAFLAMAYASLSGETHIQPLLPALKSNWLIAHVVTCFLGYAAFAVSCGAAIVFLLNSVKAETDTARQAFIEEIIHRMVLIGFLLLTTGIATGAIWADSAWGVWWSWDPKETWSLITWFIYAIMIHARLVRGWQGKRIAWMSIIGFIAVLVTYFGVNLFWSSGLHSYA